MIKAELGKQNAIHWIAMVYRKEVENAEGDQLQLLLYTLSALCQDNGACAVCVCGAVCVCVCVAVWANAQA